MSHINLDLHTHPRHVLLCRYHARRRLSTRTVSDAYSFLINPSQTYVAQGFNTDELTQSQSKGRSRFQPESSQVESSITHHDFTIATAQATASALIPQHSASGHKLIAGFNTPCPCPTHASHQCDHLGTTPSSLTPALALLEPLSCNSGICIGRHPWNLKTPSCCLNGRPHFRGRAFPTGGTPPHKLMVRLFQKSRGAPTGLTYLGGKNP